ncbi:Uncharacterised protein [Mycobacteroides abscessus subsp. abscessus]|jgi:hypothetical protein|nr:Uncharacterised protein [Mycobacteroides abscessus subsp. abscessus]
MLMQGWTVTQQAEPLPRAEIVEHERYWAQVVTELRNLRRKLEHARWRGDKEGAEDIAAQMRSHAPGLMYAHRRWERHGRWNRYYQVPSGAVHTTLTCRCINIETTLRPLPRLAGLRRARVASKYKLCRHCGTKTTADVPDALIQKVLRDNYQS